MSDPFLKTELETLVDTYGLFQVSAVLGEIEDEIEALLNADELADAVQTEPR